MRDRPRSALMRLTFDSALLLLVLLADCISTSRRSNKWSAGASVRCVAERGTVDSDCVSCSAVQSSESVEMDGLFGLSSAAAAAAVADAVAVVVGVFGVSVAFSSDMIAYTSLSK